MCLVPGILRVISPAELTPLLGAMNHASTSEILGGVFGFSCARKVADKVVFIAIIIVAVVSALAMGIPFQMTIIKMFGSINSFSLMAIPFFIIAGNIMTKAQITDKLVGFAKALLGNTKGGLAHCTTFASFLFGGIQGSGIANASAIGGMLIPAMEKQGYAKDYAVVVTTSASMMSPIVPPSIAMILYSFYTEVPVGQLFIGGFIPGALLCAGLIAVNYFIYVKRGYSIPSEPFSLRHVFKMFLKSLGALTMPMIILVGILSGLVTPTESGVLAIAYGIIYGMFITRTLKVKDLFPIIFESAKTTSVVMLIIAAAGILSNVLVRMHFQAEVLHLAVDVQGRLSITAVPIPMLCARACYKTYRCRWLGFIALFPSAWAVSFLSIS